MTFLNSLVRSCALPLILLGACAEAEPGDDNSETTDSANADDEDKGEPSAPKADAGRSRLDAGQPATGTPPRADASSVTPPKDAGTSARADAGGALDAGPANPLDGLFTPRPTTPAGDAGSTTNATGTCGGATPHGCFTPAKNNPAGCPKQSPEIPTGIPAFPDWDLCNGGAVSSGASCAWEGPLGSNASCLCDTGAHWICVYL